VIEGASRERDIYDSEKMYPPLSRYAIMFFPHRDATEPDYWPPPYDKDFAHDFRPPIITKEIWYMKFAMVYTGIETITVSWEEMNRMPPSYLPLLISQEDDSVNLFAYDSYTSVFASGIHRWKFSVEPGYYESWAISPAEATIHAGEILDFHFYLFRSPDSTMCLSASYIFEGTGGFISTDGRFTATSPGSGIVIANQGGYSDTAFVTILPCLEFDLPLALGWNLVSLPCNPPGHRLADILFGYSGNVYYYDNSLNNYIEADSLFPGIGYFVLSTRDTVLSIYGAAMDSVSADVGIGWNLLGGTSYTDHFDDFSTIPTAIIHGYPQIWDSGAYFEADSFAPYRGFWVLCGLAGTVRIITD